MKYKTLKISFEENPYLLTKITGSNFEEIFNHCVENNLVIVDVLKNNNYYIVQAEKPNQRMVLLRKYVKEIDGWKLIKNQPTRKMHWLTYEKIQK